MDSRSVRPGDLFAIIRGRRADGRAFVEQAIARGAVAVCDTAAFDGHPTLIVRDPRTALASLAAAVNGYPSRALRLIGVTGTLGKTSTVMLLEAALAATGMAPGVIGSLGVRMLGRVSDTGMTTPEAPTIHKALRRMVDAGLDTAVVEVTSHAIKFGRVAELTFALGIFTNLVPDEHLEFHRTPEDYVRTKLRFLDMLAPGAPLVINADDELVRGAATTLARPVIGVTARGAPADVSIERLRWDADGSSFVLRVSREIPGLAGRAVGPIDLPLVIPLFGVQQVMNAALASTAALVAGAPERAIASTIRGVEPIRRRMEIIHPERPLVIDDTVGNPRSLRAVFRSLRAVDAPTMTVLFGIRGSRGLTINRGLARALADLLRGRPATLIVTAAEGSATAKDRVVEAERDCFLGVLDEAGIAYRYEPRLDAAVERAVGAAGDGVLLVLGAGGMDGGAGMVREAIRARTSGSADGSGGTLDVRGQRSDVRGAPGPARL